VKVEGSRWNYLKDFAAGSLDCARDDDDSGPRLEYGRFDFRSRFLVADHQMNHSVWRGNKETIKVFP
jgi:hypothetical protein